MTDLMIWLSWQILQAALGAVIVWNLRDDERERAFGLSLGRAPWMVSALVLAGSVIWLGHPGLELWRFALAMTLVGFVLSYAHGPILSPPSQPCSSTPDHIEKALMAWLYKTPGDKMGLPMWALYAALRYGAPVTAIGYALGDDPQRYAVAGLLMILGYWPAAYMIAHGERTKYWGAGFAGAAFYGVL